MLLRMFGAKIGSGVKIMPSARIWAPWNLTMEENSCLSFNVDCYNAAPILIGANATISQYSFLCTATHDIEDPNMRLLKAPITIEAGAWVAADVYIAPGVTIGEGAVIGVRSSVFEDMPEWMVCMGTPCKPEKQRKLKKNK
jgi:putative colanic acid biosynthesis acetyltransferase WcaF